MKLSLYLESLRDWRRCYAARASVRLHPATLPRPRTLSLGARPTDLTVPANVFRQGRIAEWYPQPAPVISPDPHRVVR